MPTIERFEDILGWQSGRELCNLVYEMTKKGLFSRDFGLRDQNYISQEEFDQLYALSAQTGRRIAGFITYLEQHPDR
jgi:hypothetical protein